MRLPARYGNTTGYQGQGAFQDRQNALEFAVQSYPSQYLDSLSLAIVFRQLSAGEIRRIAIDRELVASALQEKPLEAPDRLLHCRQGT